MVATTFDAESILSTLKGFQRRTVEHVISQFFDNRATRRFLVADETGLGKTLVARGVIARTVERLLSDDSVDRIDIVYVCSNQEIAQQNIKRLNVTGHRDLPLASRLTLLAKHVRSFEQVEAEFGKPVNLVSFTPATSFEMGWRSGKAEERALIFLLLRDEVDARRGTRRTALLNLLRSGVRSVETFAGWVDWLDHELKDVSEGEIARTFVAAARERGHVAELNTLMDLAGRRRNLPEDVWWQMFRLTGRLRAELARISVGALEPDLVILDEFQRFRDLLDERTDVGQLAHHLFNYGAAKVLLLSATPFKPFSFAEETEEDHHRDFTRTLEFLAGDGAALDPAQVADRFRQFRRAAVSGHATENFVAELRRDLIRVMCRSERSDVATADMFAERVTPAAAVEVQDLLGYVALRDIAREVEAPVNLDYWKSAPYFINFSPGYRLGERLKTQLADGGRSGELEPFIRKTQRLDSGTLTGLGQVDYGNARMRVLAKQTVEAGWWQLLWMPPSLHYLVPEGPYAQPSVQDLTKRLIFSSWAATPTAVAALLSHEAERRIRTGGLRSDDTLRDAPRVRPRLRYTLESGGRPQSMMTLALFWPMPELARLGDPLAWARVAGGPVGSGPAVGALAGQLAQHLPSGEPSRGPASMRWQWAAAFRWPGTLPGGIGDPRSMLGRNALGDQPSDSDGEGDDLAGLDAHVARALEVQDSLDPAPPPPELARTVASLAMHSPANIAWRALGRIAAGHPLVTEVGQWYAAAALAEGLRTLFNRVEATVLLDSLSDPDDPYWRTVLDYCAWGNLQAVLDEHLYHLHSDEGLRELDDPALLTLARKVARTAGLRPSRYTAFDPDSPDQRLDFSSRFALRYGGRRENQEDARQPEVREAFNSPFWPFILATTGIGQEGIDFHRWCHAVVHWNTPANPVDFEQREGRVDRFAGHAIRRNLAHKHEAAIFESGDPNPWRAAFELGGDEEEQFGDFAPWWVYPGPHKIERHVMPYPLSSDISRLEQVKQDLALYRLTFGQPRQEDMLELLKQHGVLADTGQQARLRIRLDPPALGD